MAKQTTSKRMAFLAERETIDLENVEPGAKMERLHTYVREDLAKRLDHRRADRKGTKVKQVQEAVELYLKIYDDAGAFTAEERQRIKAKLEAEGYE